MFLVKDKERSDRDRDKAGSVDIITGECIEINHTHTNSKPDLLCCKTTL